jgi:hypothetical protein
VCQFVESTLGIKPSKELFSSLYFIIINSIMKYHLLFLLAMIAATAAVEICLQTETGRFCGILPLDVERIKTHFTGSGWIGVHETSLFGRKTISMHKKTGGARLGPGMKKHQYIDVLDGFVVMAKDKSFIRAEEKAREAYRTELIQRGLISP